MLCVHISWPLTVPISQAHCSAVQRLLSGFKDTFKWPALQISSYLTFCMVSLNVSLILFMCQGQRSCSRSGLFQDPTPNWQLRNAFRWLRFNIWSYHAQLRSDTVIRRIYVVVYSIAVTPLERCILSRIVVQGDVIKDWKHSALFNMHGLCFSCAVEICISM